MKLRTKTRLITILLLIAMVTCIYMSSQLFLNQDFSGLIEMYLGHVDTDYFIVSVLVIGFIYGLLILLLFEKSVLSQLAHLTANVKAIRLWGNISDRLAMKGNNELTSLADEIDGMLDVVDKSQNELRRSETRNRAILDAIPDTILQLKKDGTIFNYKAAKEGSMSIPSTGILGKKIYEVMPEDVAQEVIQNVEKALDTKEIQIFQYQLLDNHKTLDYEARLVVSEEDKVLAIISDINERKQAEEAQKKEILLKEIYHRIKNNLQVISSLLYLQSKNFKDEKVINLFTESQNRVKSMALAHEELYLSRDLTNIDFKDYIQKLINHLFQSYGVNSEVIKLKINVDDIFFGIDTAIPCGLIINELVTNSLKHAFPEGRKGKIGIDFHSIDNEYVLKVKDNGVGLPADLDFRNTESLGMQLVNMLVNQIDGTIELNSNNSTEFTVTFKEVIYKERR